MVIIDKDGNHGSVGGFGIEHYFVEEEDSSHHGKGKKGKKAKKKNKKFKKLKKMAPIFIGLGGLKLLLYHMLLKKMALFSFLSFLLSKVSFILASLVALKQFFYTPTQHRSSDSNKLEVVHIPIRKLRQNKHKGRDEYSDESKYIPITFPPETAYDTTPFYLDFAYNHNNPETFISSDESYSGNFDSTFNGNLIENSSEISNEKLNEIYNEHFKNNLSSAFDRSDSHDEKNYYKNHVKSPFV